MDYGDNAHFLLIGHDGSHNRGCEALVRTAVSVLRDEFPESFVTLASMYPEHDVPLLDIERLEVIPGVSQNPDLYEPVTPSEVRFVSRSKYRQLPYRLAKTMLPHGLVTRVKRMRKHPRPNTEDGFKQVRHLRRHMLSATAVISIGGDLFIEDYGPPIYAMESVEYAQFLGCKTIVWGASIWPLKTAWIQERVRVMLEQCALVTVRDDSSLEYLSSLGIMANVARVADGAFLMPPRSSDRTRLHWSLPPSSVVGFNGSGLLRFFLTSEKYRQVLLAIIGFLRGVIDKQNCGVVLVPHDAYPGERERDFLFEIMQAIDRPDLLYMPPIGLDARETKAVIGQCNFFIAMRFHPTIASLSQSIPTLSLSHSPKFAGLHQDVYGHTDYLVPYEDMSIDVLSSILEKLQAEQDSIRKNLNSCVNELQEAARRNRQYIKALLG